jgi:hypothetical protein
MADVADVLKGVEGVLPATYDVAVNYADPSFFPVKDSKKRFNKRDEGPMGLYFFDGVGACAEDGKARGAAASSAKGGGQVGSARTCAANSEVVHYKGALKLMDVLKWLKKKSR